MRETSRMMRRIACLVCVASAFMSPQAHAWPPATHVYLVERITGSRDPDIIYGSMAADFDGAVLFNKKARAVLKHMTHFEFDRLEPGKFATGFASHNGEWGADYYAHLYYDESAAPIYSTKKLRQLSIEFGISMNQAEDSFEGVIEFLIRIEYGPELGRLIVDSAARSTHEEELVKAFALPLSERAGLSFEDAANEVRRAARTYQAVALTYGKQLMIEDEDYLRKLAVLALQAYLGFSPERAKQYLERGIKISKDDYQAEMDRITRNIRAKMIASPRYAEHCAPAPDQPAREGERPREPIVP